MFGLVRMWLRLALAAGILTGASALLWHWSERLPDPRPPRSESEPQPGNILLPAPLTFGERLAAWSPGFDRTTALLAGGLLLSAVSLGGGRAFWWLRLRARGSADDPPWARCWPRPAGGRRFCSGTASAG